MPENNMVPVEQVKKVKRHLEVWRELLLPVHSVLVWDKPWYPGALVGASTVCFLLFWYLDPSALTTFGFCSLILCVGDYVFRLLRPHAQFSQNDKWTGKEEKKFEELCYGLVAVYALTNSSVSNFFQMRDTRSKTFYAVTILSSLVLTWLGNAINNLFLSYLFVTGALLVPGMKKQGIVQSWISTLMSAISQTTKSDKKEKKSD